MNLKHGAIVTIIALLLPSYAVALAEDDAATEEIIVAGTVTGNALPKIPGLPTMTGPAGKNSAPTPTSQTDPPTTVKNYAEKVEIGDPYREPIRDKIGLLDAASKAALNTKLADIHQQGLAQIGILIVASTAPDDIASYSIRMASQWQLGDDALDNGILIVVAANDRRMRIETGYGVEGVLPDIICYQIIDKIMSPAFKNDDYAGGLNAAIDTIVGHLSQDPQILAQSKKWQAAAKPAKQNILGSLLIIGIGLALFSRLLQALIGRLLASTGVGAIGGVTAFAIGAPVMGGVAYGVALMLFVMIGGGYWLSRMVIDLHGSSGGMSGGGFGGGGYSGGGGDFGGGGASGSW